MTLARPMFPPRGETTRRNFLTQAAGVAAGSAALSVMTVAPAPAVAAPTAIPRGSKALQVLPGSGMAVPKSPTALTAAVRALDEASLALAAAKAVNDAEDEKLTQWTAANPAPSSRRGLKRWHRKLSGYRVQTSQESWSVLLDAERRFRSAQFAVAMIQPNDPDELALMAAVSAVYDNTQLQGRDSAVIGYQVALSYVRLHGSAIGGAA